jgi:hypothetical protein
MSINIKILKFITVLSFLLINGVQEHGVPNFALLLIYLYQFFNDIFTGASTIFWGGLITIPIYALLILFFISESYRILLMIFFLLFVILIYITGIPNNYHRINLAFIIPTALFIISAIVSIVLEKRKSSFTT